MTLEPLLGSTALYRADVTWNTSSCRADVSWNTSSELSNPEPAGTAWAYGKTHQHHREAAAAALLQRLSLVPPLLFRAPPVARLRGPFPVLIFIGPLSFNVSLGVVIFIGCSNVHWV